MIELFISHYCQGSATLTRIIYLNNCCFKGYSVCVCNVLISFQAPLICTPGYPKSTLPWPSHFLWGHLPGLFLPEQTACHLLQGQPGSEPRRFRRPAAKRLWTQVRTYTTCYTCFMSNPLYCKWTHLQNYTCRIPRIMPIQYTYMHILYYITLTLVLTNF